MPKKINSQQKVKYSFKKVMTGSDLSSRRLALMEIESKNPGPTIWLTGAIHGEEVGGVVVIQEVFKRLRREGLISGTIKAIPLMNPIGFENVSREIPVTQEDLNRSFPGNKNGYLAERIADTIFSTINKTKPDLVLDLHNDWTQSIPYTLIDPKPISNAGSKAHDKALEIAQKTGFLVIEESGDYQINKTLSGSLLEIGVPSLTIELGEAFVVNEKNVAVGVMAVWNILTHLKMVTPTESGEIMPILPEKYINKVLDYSDKPTSSSSGIVRFLAKPGNTVKKGETIARIYNVFGKLEETIKALQNGIVLGHSDYSVTFPGAPVFAFGVSKDEN